MSEYNSEEWDDIFNSRLVDVAGNYSGNKTTLIFERGDGSLHGLQFDKQSIEFVDVKENSSENGNTGEDNDLL